MKGHIRRTVEVFKSGKAGKADRSIVAGSQVGVGYKAKGPD